MVSIWVCVCLCVRIRVSEYKTFASHLHDNIIITYVLYFTLRYTYIPAATTMAPRPVAPLSITRVIPTSYTRLNLFYFPVSVCQLSTKNTSKIDFWFLSIVMYNLTQHRLKVFVLHRLLSSMM